jgi:hypothetical protein
LPKTAYTLATTFLTHSPHEARHDNTELDAAGATAPIELILNWNPEAQSSGAKEAE